ncbi:aspartate/glutamate racemase family protein [Streptomyces sp. NPDC059918]|uniref:aspartate/glutamate racemase family protein n=1 Tax=unclassified Streptomyces TaxID=2593676 RepID=UPI003659AA51
MKSIGIVGGVGPYASLYFCHELLRLSGATADEDYPATILVAEQMPSRIEHLLGRGESPLPALLRTVEKLEHAGADVIAIPSATTHAYWQQLAQAVDIPVCDLLAETGLALAASGSRRPLFLATEATAALGLYEPHLADGTVARYPDRARQSEVSDFIERVKRGDPLPELREKFGQWIDALGIEYGGDPDCVVLACTELSLIAPTSDATPMADVTHVLASAVLAY